MKGFTVITLITKITLYRLQTTNSIHQHSIYQHSQCADEPKYNSKYLKLHYFHFQ